VWSNVTFLLYFTSGGIVLAPFAATTLVLRRRLMWSLAFGLAFAAAIFNAALASHLQSDASSNMLSRDIAAVAILAFACPIVSAAATLAYAQSSSYFRAGIATVIVVGFGFVAPYFLLVAHCTSGDCL
jgi:hypothetical protein